MTRILTLAFMLLAAPAFAQQTVSISLTAAEVHALQVTFGSDADVQAKMQQWVHDWCVQFTRQVQETEQRQLREALVKMTPEQEAQVRTLLAVPTPVAVTAEERETRRKAREAETKRIADEKAAAVEAERARLVADAGAMLKNVLVRCAAYNKTLPEGATPIPCETFVR